MAWAVALTAALVIAPEKKMPHRCALVLCDSPAMKANTTQDPRAAEVAFANDSQIIITFVLAVQELMVVSPEIF